MNESECFLRLPAGSRWRRPERVFSAPRRALAVRDGRLIRWDARRGLRAAPFTRAALDRALREGRWWLLAGYEFADRLERLPRRQPGLQRLPELLAFDFSASEGAHPAPPGFGRFLAAAGLSGRIPARAGARLPDRRAHAAGVRAIRAAIGAGDYYQANLTRPFLKRGRIDADRLAGALWPAVKPAYGFHLKAGALEIVSISPELLVESFAGRLRARPIAGSRPRGTDARADARLARELRASAKDAAEHEMLVDLLRNDLGRVARFGSVRVTRRRVVERHARVLSMVSTVEGEPAPGRDALDALWAAFPGGTISGCPKPAVLAALRRIEPHARNYYTGSFGWLELGEGVFNILIRTVTITGTGPRRMATWGAGGGIVHDSRAADEWRELLAKGEAIARALERP